MKQTGNYRLFGISSIICLLAMVMICGMASAEEQAANASADATNTTVVEIDSSGANAVQDAAAIDAKETTATVEVVNTTETTTVAPEINATNPSSDLQKLQDAITAANAQAEEDRAKLTGALQNVSVQSDIDKSTAAFANLTQQAAADKNTLEAALSGVVSQATPGTGAEETNTTVNTTSSA